jgi:hypothetical protein
MLATTLLSTILKSAHAITEFYWKILKSFFISEALLCTHKDWQCFSTHVQQPHYFGASIGQGTGINNFSSNGIEGSDALLLTMPSSCILASISVVILLELCV